MLKLDFILNCLHALGMTQDFYEFRLNMCATQKIGANLYDFPCNFDINLRKNIENEKMLTIGILLHGGLLCSVTWGKMIN